jgi:hypothetical protein
LGGDRLSENKREAKPQQKVTVYSIGRKRNLVKRKHRRILKSYSQKSRSEEPILVKKR